MILFPVRLVLQAFNNMNQALGIGYVPFKKGIKRLKLACKSGQLTKTMLLTARHKSIAQLFDPDFWKIS
ncbi:hypothetical protein SDC9_138161 [bioreactor metagenome]|uniref:Uncharacterized protein n=1 Tax=bioreactor metagenome TaxID=1076179 RepID=A0A645DP22_9ZZZZ